MYALVDTRDQIKVTKLNTEDREMAEKLAMAMLSSEEKIGCETLEDYQESLTISGWYHVVWLDG